MRRHWLPLLLFIIVIVISGSEAWSSFRQQAEDDRLFSVWLSSQRKSTDTVWRGLDQYQIPGYTEEGKLILYGRELIAHTSTYLGPRGTVSHISNGMNCQNCHLDGGTLPFGNNYGKVYSTYPQYRARNNGIQTIYGRVEDCFERSLNGVAPDSGSREMKAIYAYIKWLGAGIPKGVVRGGTGIMKLAMMDRAADPGRGSTVYVSNCASCHGVDGSGVETTDGNGYVYPPLWGTHSYNDGAGLYRLSNFAGFVRNNMPFGTDYHNPRLTDEEAWDVAAYVNSQPRPHKDQSGDWKDVGKKPVDFPVGPFTDSFSERQHKYGPWQAMVKGRS